MSVSPLAIDATPMADTERAARLGRTNIAAGTAVGVVPIEVHTLPVTNPRSRRTRFAHTSDTVRGRTATDVTALSAVRIVVRQVGADRSARDQARETFTAHPVVAVWC